MSGPIKCAMYKLNPAYILPEKIDLPSNMYKLSKVADVGEPNTDILHVVQDKSYAGELSSLELRWDIVLQQLAGLKKQLLEIKKSVGAVPAQNNTTVTSKQPLGDQIKVLDGAVINSNPSSPPYSLLLLQRLYKDELEVSVSSYVHSTVVTSLPEELKIFNTSISGATGLLKLRFVLIWKDGLEDTELVINPSKQIPIRGEVNILRFLARLGLHSLNYGTDNIQLTQNDIVLDLCYRLLHQKDDGEKAACFQMLGEILGKKRYFGNEEINISDIAVWSTVKQIGSKNVRGNLSQWFSKISEQVK